LTPVVHRCIIIHEHMNDGPLMNDELTMNRPADFVPAPVLRITDVATLRILADPLRIRILEAFGAHPGHALTVKTVAAALGEPVTKLYYHVNLLEEHKLLVVVSTHLVSGIVEKRYRVAAETIEVDRGLVGASAAHMAPDVQAILDAVFGASRGSLERALLSGKARLGLDEPAPGMVVLARDTQRLTPAAAAEVRRLIARLFEQIRDLATPGDPDEPTAAPDRPQSPGDAQSSDDPSSPDDPRPYGLLVAFHPIADGADDSSAPDRSPGGTA
jgi:DNA-binding transcriptional ArsR family regulator